MGSNLLQRFSPEELARMALAERCRRSLAFFTRAAWHIVEPGTPLRWNWHIEAVCRALEAVTRGEILRLIINLPPGLMKSLLVSVMWPAWEWTFRPEERSLFASYAMELAMRDSVRCRSIISSPWYQETFRPAWRMAGDQNVKSYFENTQKGFRMALSVGGAGTGFRGRKVVVDDPLSAMGAESEATREDALNWWTKTMPTRVNDPENGAFVVVQQRLHEKDLAGHLLKQGGYVHLCLPSEFEAAPCPCGLQPCSTGPLGKLDPRTQPGELLFPSMFTPQVLADLKTTLGSAGYAGQHLQRPAPAEGGMFKRHWWRFYRVAPARFDEVIQSWDFAFKETKSSDFVVGQVWGRLGADKYLLDQVRARMDFTDSVRAVRNLTTKWPAAMAKLVEGKANGPAIISTLRREVPGLIEVEPRGSKEARASSVTPQVEAGNVYLPEPSVAPWVSAFVEEHAAFPGANDDQVDACSQALARLGLSSNGVQWSNLSSPRRM